MKLIPDPKSFHIAGVHVHRSVAFGPGQERLLVEHWGFTEDDLGAAVEAGTCRRAEPPATRAARALAREHALDLSDVEATGTGGRITKADVEAHLNDQPDAEQAEE